MLDRLFQLFFTSQCDIYFLSVEIMVFRKLKEGTGIGERWGHGRSPPRRGSPRGAWLWIVLRQRKRKI